MHELSIAQSIAEAVAAQASACQATKVRSVHLRIGEANSIVTNSLAFCFDMLTSLEPLLSGAQLLIDTVPHRAWCEHCASEFPVQNFVAQCPTCSEWSNTIVSGTELQILAMEVDTTISSCD